MASDVARADTPFLCWDWSAHGDFSPLATVFPRTFNPADYAEPAQTEENYGGGSTWNNTGSIELEEGPSKLTY